MAFTAREYRAIQYVANRNHWKLSLCAAPVVFYVATDGKTVKKPIQDVLSEYDQGRREDRTAARRNVNVSPPDRRYSPGMS